jgi:two-component system CheB/CheR fusion protein
LATVNEELVATNEELAAVNEEMAATNEELTETQGNLRKKMEELAATESRFRFLLNAIPQQVWTATPDGALDYVNEVICSDFGYSTEEIVGHGWQKFIHPDDLPGCLEKWVSALSSGNDYIVEFRLLFQDGSYQWHMGKAVPLIEDGKINLWIGTNTNIELQKNNEQKKDEFLSIASHELKTPLTNIKAFNQLLQKVKDPEKLAPFVDRSSEHINRLERLINDLLDVTKINAGKMTYHMESFDFGKMINEAVESARLIDDKREILLNNKADIPYTGDYYRLEQVVNNFISNALKYSPAGSSVIVSATAGPKNITVSVQDFGIGIAAENIGHLFDRYYRVDNTAMRFPGLGLGLFISSEIIKRHHGSFWIESELGKGSTFYFRLPRD